MKCPPHKTNLPKLRTFCYLPPPQRENQTNDKMYTCSSMKYKIEASLISHTHTHVVCV